MPPTTRTYVAPFFSMGKIRVVTFVNTVIGDFPERFVANIGVSLGLQHCASLTLKFNAGKAA